MTVLLATLLLELLQRTKEYSCFLGSLVVANAISEITTVGRFVIGAPCQWVQALSQGGPGCWRVDS